MQSLPAPVRIKLLTLAYEPSLAAIDARPLDAFLAEKELLDVREHFFVVQQQPHLLCVIRYRLLQRASTERAAARDPAPDRANGAKETGRIELDGPERALFATLRAWRAERARRDGVPAYVVCTNRELAELARQRPTSKAALLAVAGFGEGKVTRYGDELLGQLGGAGNAGASTPAEHGA